MAKTKKYNAPVHFEKIKSRLIIVSVVFSFYGAGLIARLVYLQILKHEELHAQSEKQYVRTIKINSGRGLIYDRNLNSLAINIEVESVYINPREIVDKDFTANRLASILGLARKTVDRKISSGKSFVWIKRKSNFSEIEKLKELDLAGVGFIGESKRFYPKRELAASAIGFVGLDNQGLGGIEHQYHSTLKGISYRKVVEKDARGRLIRTGREADKLNAHSRDVVLTLDEVIQFITERELKKQIQKFHAKSGVAIVMDPNNGEILAMADIPEFNPNNFSAFPSEYYRNKAVTDTYEPGSIFKPIVAAAALESRKADIHDIFYCENGQFKIGSVVIGEASGHKFGWLTLQNIIAKSSNIGAIKLAQRLGKNTFYDYIKKFGFGKKLGIELPGEATGIVRRPHKWTALSLASISFGHEISVTPIQMITAMSAIANGGNLIRPKIIRAVIKDGQLDQPTRPLVIKRVLSEKTSQQMIGILKTAVKSGTGKKAAAPGFDVAGKTGTAQKMDKKTRRYSKTAFVSSFIGFVPADDPKLAILVMVDEPQGTYWGGEVAAPAFREIAIQVLRYLNVPSNQERVFVLDHA